MSALLRLTFVWLSYVSHAIMRNPLLGSEEGFLGAQVPRCALYRHEMTYPRTSVPEKCSFFQESTASAPVKMNYTLAKDIRGPDMFADMAWGCRGPRLMYVEGSCTASNDVLGK
jgi:hypothetical protein